MVYISGGAAGKVPHILKGNWRFTEYETVAMLVPTTVNGIAVNSEVEGIQLHGDNVYVGVEQHPQSGGTALHQLYYFPKSTYSI
ncbi:hypothetical protein [Secundilactobacillus folii]|uniref:hypothetical protein n=1 Tax=Secundilactobacillus folii TaxID=2678357 RepID=UPI0015644A2D|nr:hypothetical protein [Secundilactobacillus folii]